MRPSAPVLSEVPASLSLRTALVLLATLGAAPLAGCLPSQTPAAKASDAARDLNMSMRWGRTEVALEYASAEDRSDFLERHAGWHVSQRILETELAGLYMVDATHAIVQVDVEWLLDDDTNLRTTRLEQKWTEKAGKWQLTEEKHVSGAEGLFGEEVERDKPRRDAHFPTKVIR